jgi:hypothetical protein
VPVGAVVALLSQALGGTPLRDLSRRGVAAAAATMAILLSHIAANGLMLHRWTLDPVGSTFLFARLNEDGLIEPWMRNHCADVPELCGMYPELPKDSQQLLWGTNSPFVPLIWDRLGSHTEGPILSELNRASAGSIRDHPVRFLEAAGTATIEQLIHFAPLDDECPAVCTSPTSAVYDLFERRRPDLMPWFRQSAQFRGTLPKSLITLVTVPIAAFATLLLVGLAFVARRRRDTLAESLIWTVLASMLVNAALAGTFSDVHDRYQSRIVWLAPFAALLTLLRFYRAKAEWITPAIGGGSTRPPPSGEESVRALGSEDTRPPSPSTQ